MRHVEFKNQIQQVFLNFKMLNSFEIFPLQVLYMILVKLSLNMNFGSPLNTSYMYRIISN